MVFWTPGSLGKNGVDSGSFTKKESTPGSFETKIEVLDYGLIKFSGIFS